MTSGNMGSHLLYFLLVLVCSNQMAIGGDGLCKDVTVGDCPLDDDYVIQTVSLTMPAELCQDLCFQQTNCVVFQHNAENCTLFREDYRQHCKTSGGPSVTLDCKGCVELELHMYLNSLEKFN